MIDRGFVTYSNEAKHAMLGVPTTTLATFGAVSKETAIAMAVGALENAEVDLAVSITGIAGPGGATPGKPVGLVHFAAAARDGRITASRAPFRRDRTQHGAAAFGGRSLADAAGNGAPAKTGGQAAPRGQRLAAARGPQCATHRGETSGRATSQAEEALSDRRADYTGTWLSRARR